VEYWGSIAQWIERGGVSAEDHLASVSFTLLGAQPAVPQPQALYNLHFEFPLDRLLRFDADALQAKPLPTSPSAVVAVKAEARRSRVVRSTKLRGADRSQKIGAALHKSGWRIEVGGTLRRGVKGGGVGPLGGAHSQGEGQGMCNESRSRGSRVGVAAHRGGASGDSDDEEGRGGSSRPQLLDGAERSPPLPPLAAPPQQIVAWRSACRCVLPRLPVQAGVLVAAGECALPPFAVAVGGTTAFEDWLLLARRLQGLLRVSRKALRGRDMGGLEESGPEVLLVWATDAQVQPLVSRRQLQCLLDALCV
jgi:hypothetical protein